MWCRRRGCRFLCLVQLCFGFCLFFCCFFSICVPRCATAITLKMSSSPNWNFDLKFLRAKWTEWKATKNKQNPTTHSSISDRCCALTISPASQWTGCRATDQHLKNPVCLCVVIAELAVCLNLCPPPRRDRRPAAPCHLLLMPFFFLSFFLSLCLFKGGQGGRTSAGGEAPQPSV